MSDDDIWTADYTEQDHNRRVAQLAAFYRQERRCQFWTQLAPLLVFFAIIEIIIVLGRS